MTTAGTITGVLMILVGALWALQGFGIVGGSFMTGQPKWLVIGILLLITGPVLLVWANLRAKPPRGG